MQEPQEVENTEVEPPLLTAARQYFKAVADESTILRDEMSGAKTKTKARYFQKKLTANNKIALQLLERIAMLERSKAKVREALEAAEEDEEVNEYR